MNRPGRSAEQLGPPPVEGPQPLVFGHAPRLGKCDTPQEGFIRLVVLAIRTA